MDWFTLVIVWLIVLALIVTHFVSAKEFARRKRRTFDVHPTESRIDVDKECPLHRQTIMSKVDDHHRWYACGCTFMSLPSKQIGEAPNANDV